MKFRKEIPGLVVAVLLMTAVYAAQAADDTQGFDA